MIKRRIGKVVGDSAYQIALNNGFVGTEEEWLESLKGTSFNITGTVNTVEELPDVNSVSIGTAYFVGTEPLRDVYVLDITRTWINQGKIQGPIGPQGEQGIQGPQGLQGPQGERGPTGKSVNAIKVNSEEEALIQSQSNPDNVYYWSGEKPNQYICSFKNDNSQREYTNEKPIILTDKVFDNTNGKISSSTNGNFTVKHDGYLKLSFCLWIGANQNIRPWIQVKNLTKGNVVLNCITDTSGDYTTLTASNLITQVSSGDILQLIFKTSYEPAYIDKGSDGACSYITFELI